MIRHCFCSRLPLKDWQALCQWRVFRSLQDQFSRSSTIDAPACVVPKRDLGQTPALSRGLLDEPNSFGRARSTSDAVMIALPGTSRRRGSSRAPFVALLDNGNRMLQQACAAVLKTDIVCPPTPTSEVDLAWGAHASAAPFPPSGEQGGAVPVPALSSRHPPASLRAKCRRGGRGLDDGHRHLGR